MLTEDEARTLVMAELERFPTYLVDGDTNDSLVVDDSSTIETHWGWVFFYASRRYLSTRDIRHALAGNAPYFVNRHTREVRATGTAKPIEQYIVDYEREISGR